MILFEQALKIVTESDFRLESERVGLLESVNRILAEDVVSDINMPPFNKSAVDGFACRRSDIERRLEIVEVIPAGKMPEKEIKENQCSKIMTGSCVPAGADCVVMVENSSVNGDFVTFSGMTAGNNICSIAEDVKIGQVVLKRGTKILPAHIAIMATAGCTNPLVCRKVKVGIISTGSELVEPTEKPHGAKIRNSNSYQLYAQAEQAGAIATYYGIAEDSEEETYKIIKKASAESNIVIISGGVSMGDYDFVPVIMKQLGFEILFKSIAVQPGKPTVFARNGNVFCFGLPGNPVSSYIQFELLVKHLISVLSGAMSFPGNLKLQLRDAFSRKKGDRLALVPVKINADGTIGLIDYHGSAHINSMASADGIMFVEQGVLSINSGDFVSVRQI